MRSVEDRLLRSLRAQGRGAVVTPRDFLQWGTRASVDKALSRLVERGALRRVGRGVYDLPRTNPLVGPLSPDPEQVAQALARNGAQRLLPNKALAANQLGLTEQVPAKMEFLTDGPTRTRWVENLPVVLKRTTPRNVATAGRVTGTVMQALRFFGPKKIDEIVVQRLRDRLSPADKQQLLRDIRLVPAWIGEVFRKISAEPGSARKTT